MSLFNYSFLVLITPPSPARFTKWLLALITSPLHGDSWHGSLQGPILPIPLIPPSKFIRPFNPLQLVPNPHYSSPLQRPLQKPIFDIIRPILGLYQRYLSPLQRPLLRKAIFQHQSVPCWPFSTLFAPPPPKTLAKIPIF